MARGGKRVGAGQPVDESTRPMRARAEQAGGDGITPLDVMLRAMRDKVASNDLDGAVAIAKAVAPYMHPKLAALSHTGRDGGPIHTVDLSHMTETELATLEHLFGPIAGPGDGDGGDQGGAGA